ncbi:MAG TPA: phosphotransferase family protein [Acidimicrobiales bacterium]|nr:phosphotransferase family protein [Acidimicrobiales bacterium]
MADAVLTLPADVISWVEEAAGGAVVHADRIPGGATREAWYVDVRPDAGDVQHLFVRYSAERLPERSAFHPLAVEAEMMMALHGAGVTVPHVLAVHPTREAILAERVSGATWFYRIKDPAEQVRVAQDFIANLARVHRLDPRDLPLPSLGPVKTAREHALDRIRDIRWRGTAPDGSINPLLRLTVDWLERNVPDYEGPVVVVQGDTGPGNFLYEDGRVTAVVDWELSHFGDPMDDIAWLSLRTVQDTFTHLPDRLREYEELSGHRVDTERVWYYRLFAEATMYTLRPNEGSPDDATRGRPAARDVGNGLLYTQLHRRLWLEALTAVMGLKLPAPDLAPPPPAPEWHPLYDEVLGSLATIVPRIADPLASQWTKGLARAVKYLQELDLCGRSFADLERDDIAAVLGHAPDTLEEARAELAAAARAGKVAEDAYVRVLWNKVLRDDHLLRTASGALHERTWPPLV